MPRAELLEALAVMALTMRFVGASTFGFGVDRLQDFRGQKVGDAASDSFRRPFRREA